MNQKIEVTAEQLAKLDLLIARKKTNAADVADKVVHAVTDVIMAVPHNVITNIINDINDATVTKLVVVGPVTALELAAVGGAKDMGSMSLDSDELKELAKNLPLDGLIEFRNKLILKK